jgi:peptidyl-prolyl cis-trans isomerase D
MITTIRKHIKSGLFKAIMWLFLIVLGAMFLMPDTMSNRTQSMPWIARINGTEISAQVFGQTVTKQEYNIHMLRQQYGQYADMFMQMLGLDQDPKKVALQELVRDEVMNQVVEKIPLYIHRDYIDQKFNDLNFVQQSGLYTLLPLGFFNAEGLDENALRGYLMKMGITSVQFETMVEQAMARYIALELAGLAAYSPSYVLEDAINNELGKKKYALLTFSLDAVKAEEKKKGVSEQELQTFFDMHNKRNKRYWIPEQRAGIVWEFNPEAYGITITADEIQRYYDAQKLKKYIESPSQVQVRRIVFKSSVSEPRAAVMQRAQQVRSELLKKPEDFAKIAKEQSADTASSSNGGLLPFFSKGERDQTFERKAFLMKDTGEISELFESPDGFELLQLVSKKPVQYKPLSKVKSEIEQTLLHQTFAKDFSKDLKKVLDATGINEGALEKFVENKKHKKASVPLTEKDDSKRAAVLFRLKSGEADFYIDGNIGYIVQVTDIKPRSAPQLEAVKSVVESDLLQDRAEKSLVNRIEQAKEAIKHKDPAAVAKEYNAVLEYTDMLHKENKEEIEKLKAAHKPIEKMLQLGKVGALGSHFDGNKGFLFYVAEAENIDKEMHKDKQLQAVARANYERKGLFIEGFVASLSENATIETNNSILNLSETHSI